MKQINKKIENRGENNETRYDRDQADTADLIN